jgi:biotin-dependent carboxylase-like uncharacterized protein
VAIAVLTPGPLTTVQDLGRFGARAWGVPQGGALDGRSFRAANALVGNAAPTAGLEFTLRGPVLRFLHATTFAITGAEFGARLGAARCPLWTEHRARAGQELDLGSCTRGVRGYLAVQGGVDVPEVLGSRSTCLRGAFGGLDGRALQAGDWLAVGGQPPAASGSGGWRPQLAGPFRLPLRRGPHAALLRPEDWSRLAAGPLTLRPDSDRMGARLDGVDLQAEQGELLTIPTLPGCVQLTRGGQVIVLLNDAQTTGGYPLIGTVPTDRLGDLAQARPGAAVYFDTP